MLAAHLARIKRNAPVRYARDPAVDQAIRNYLAIALRARQVPRLMGGLLTHPSMGAVGHVLGSDAPLGRQLAVDLIQTNDPGPLVALLDLLAEHGVAGQHQHAPHQADMLRAVLDDLHGHIHRPGEAGPEPHPAIVRGYADQNLRRTDDQSYRGVAHAIPGHIAGAVRSMVVSPTGGDTAMGYLLDLLARHRERDPGTPRPITQGLQQLEHGEGHALISLHDMLQGDESPAGRQAIPHLRGGIQTLHNLLWQYGDTGQ